MKQKQYYIKNVRTNGVSIVLESMIKKRFSRFFIEKYKTKLNNEEDSLDDFARKFNKNFSKLLSDMLRAKKNIEIGDYVISELKPEEINTENEDSEKKGKK